MPQQSFNPINYNFEWTEPTDQTNPHDLGWYTWDRETAIKEAKKARSARVKELKSQGYNPTTFSMTGQLITRGGIGSGHPQIEHYVTVFFINY